MSCETFDIVDQNNNSLNIVKSRDEVHKNLIDWHRVTHIWIVNSEKQILCQQRSLKKDANPGKWQSFFGGHLKSGENYEQNAIGELKEELGTDINADSLRALYIRKSETAKHFAHVYVLKLDKDISKFSYNDKEVEQVKWFSIENLNQAISKQEFCNSLDEKVFEFIFSGRKPSLLRRGRKKVKVG